MRVGFIGLGLMGNPMAKNILKAGFQLTVYNRTGSKTEELKGLGARAASSPRELAEISDVVITMVTAAKDVEDVLFGKEGVIFSERAKSKADPLIIMDMSTIGPTAAREISKKLEPSGIAFIDAPVTGSTPKAITGELTIFAGGDSFAFGKVRPVLLSMGKSIHYMGESGSGQAIKMINNQVIAATIEAVAEGMLLADAMGLERKRAAEVLKTVPAFSFMMNLKMPNYVDDDYPLLFSTANMKKDLTLAIREMKKGKKDLPVLEKLEEIFAKAERHYGNEDFSEVIKVLN
jgi:3-hydroxyisobutyrate dehydrogenase